MIIRAENAIPHEVGDAVIALFVVEVVGHVQLLHALQKFILGFVGQMLEAMAKLIKTIGQGTSPGVF